MSTSTNRIRCLAALVLLSSAPVFAASEEDERIRAFESSLRPVVSVEGEPEQRWTLSERMAHWKVPGLSVAVIRNGKIAWAKGYGVLQVGKPEKVDTQTVFSVASMSKVGAATITLQLVDAGKLHLDRDVNTYLTRWKLPENFNTAIHPVTLRGILSHSAGLSVHGFNDFQPGETLPTVLETLDGKATAKNEPVRVVHVPGSRFQYSGGGVTVEQLIIEEATGLGFPSAARRYLFEPLRMSRSSFENPLPESHGNIAKAHAADGRPRALPRGYEAMPEMAASGLWTTPTDYAQLVLALIESYRGAPGSLLSTAQARQMFTEVGRSSYGLGPELEGQGLERRFSHGGANDSYRSWMEGHPNTGNGMVICVNGANGSGLNREVRRAVAAAEGWAPALSFHVRAPAISLSRAELQERAGAYEIERSLGISGFRHALAAVAVKISHRDGSLYLSAAGENEMRLFPEDPSRFVTEGDGIIRVEFVRGYEGRVNRLMIRFPNAVIEATKVDGVPADGP